MRPATCECGACRKCRHRLYMRRWYEAHPGYAAERMRQRRQDNPEATRAYEREEYRRNKAKHLARMTTTSAVRRGKLARPDACEQCGATGSVAAHHDDYAQPLNVRWLCRSCHGLQHRAA